MKKMEIRQTKMSGRVRRANCGRSANSSERLGDLLVRRLAGMRLITPYNLPLNNCLICFKPLDPVKPYQAIWILMRGPYQIWAGAFFFTSSSLASTLATSPTLKTKPDPRDWRSHWRRNVMAFRWIAGGTVRGCVFFSGGRPLGQLRALLGDEESRLRNETNTKGSGEARSAQVCELLLRGGYREIQLFPCKGQRDGPPGGFKTSAMCDKKWRSGRFVRRYFGRRC